MVNDKIPELTNAEFDSFIKSGTVLVDFFAEWCMPCLMMAPVLEELSEKFKGKIKFGKVNVDENNKLAQKYHVTSIPTFVLLKNGERIEQFIGAIPQEEFREKLKKMI